MAVLPQRIAGKEQDGNSEIIPSPNKAGFNLPARWKSRIGSI